MPRMTVVTLTRRPTDAEPEAETATIDTDPDTTEITLDDGEILEFDTAQLRAALREPGAHSREQRAA